VKYVRYLIVGIDPGNTVGIAALGMDGRVVALRSTANGIDEAIRIIEGLGTPSIVATDVYPAPAAVLRAASSFNARLFAPRENVREDVKREIAQGAGVSNAHERDAYCAAVLAYRAHANRLRQISALGDFSQEEKEELMHLAINGQSLRSAIFALESQKEDAGGQSGTQGGAQGRQAQAQGAQKQEIKPGLKAHEKLREEIFALSRENAHLKKLVQTLENEKETLALQVQKLARGSRESIMRDAHVRKLQYRINVLEEIMARMRSHKGKKGSGNQIGARWGGKFPAGNSGAPGAAPIAGAPTGASKGIKELQGNRESRQAKESLDMERLVEEYRRKRQATQ